MNQLLHWMLLWTKLKESLVEEVLLSQLAGYDHQTMSCLILIVMISMCPQHLVYSRWQSQSMVVVTVQCLLWLRIPVMCAQALPSPSPSQPETGVGRMVPLLLHPTPSVSLCVASMSWHWRIVYRFLHFANKQQLVHIWYCLPAQICMQLLSNHYSLTQAFLSVNLKTMLFPALECILLAWNKHTYDGIWCYKPAVAGNWDLSVFHENTETLVYLIWKKSSWVFLLLFRWAGYKLSAYWMYTMRKSNTESFHNFTEQQCKQC